MIIGIDIDDTISDTYEVMMNYAQEYTVEVLKKEPIIKEDISCDNHFYTMYLHDWKDGEDVPFLEKYYKSIVKNTKPKTLALKYLKKLQSEGNKIILITARWEADYFDVKKATEDWIKENDIPCDKLIINASDKLIACKEEKVDVFIDDSFHNCQAVSKAGIKTYMMDTRVNRNLKDDKIERVYSWPHVYFKLHSELYNK